MTRNPYLSDLVLQPCCKDALNKINQNLKSANIKQVLIDLPFFNIIGDIDNTFVTVTNNNWNELVAAMEGVPTIVKEMNKTLANDEIINHHGGGKSYAFWRGICEALY